MLDPQMYAGFDLKFLTFNFKEILHNSESERCQPQISMAVALTLFLFLIDYTVYALDNKQRCMLNP